MGSDSFQTHLNPPWLAPRSYISFLNQAFPRQWSDSTYAWYVARPFNGRRNDLLVRADGSRIVAGVTLCYRQVLAPAGAPLDICVLSAGATLPSERGRGHYVTLLHEAFELCRTRGCVAAIGYVTHDNFSGREFTRLGARAIPSFYITSSDRRQTGDASRIVARFDGGRAIEALESRRAGGPRAPNSLHVRFYYERGEDWRQQFIHRANEVWIARPAYDSLAVIEPVGSTDRLQLLACPEAKVTRHIAGLAAASARAGRKFFMYTLDPHQAASARRWGLTVRRGYLMIHRTGHSGEEWERLANAPWAVQSGDRL